MLSLLHIENIAVIERADIEFQSGLNVLTGETGAGKSIVIDAISAVIGERTGRDIIRTGAASALASAVFAGLPALPWLEENGVEPDEDGALLLQRQIFADGKNVCRINGRPVTVGQLRGLGSQLLNIHGQHDGQQLLDERYHLLYLDRFGGTETAGKEYRACYGRMAALERELRALDMDEAEKARRTESLAGQIKELERANLREGEEEELTARRNILRHSERLIGAVETAYDSLYGDEDRDGAVSLLTAAERALAGAADISAGLSALSERVAELRYAAEDAAESVRDMKDGFDFSPEELDRLEGRLDLIYRLKRKYGGSEAELLALLDRCRSELDDIQFAGDAARRLEQKLSEERERVRAAGAALTKARRAAAGELEKRILSELGQLDMNRVRFSVEFFPKEPDGTGMDQVRFLMSANAGEELRPIQKIASGGELARIMLAMKNVLAENDDVGTMVFDEVDTGVSGRAAQKVAEKLFQAAGSKQVLCVTHLPQIAAMADAHFSVEKGEAGGRTYTEVRRMSHEERRQELARITGGAKITEKTLDGAEELLVSAAAFKKQVLEGRGRTNDGI